MKLIVEKNKIIIDEQGDFNQGEYNVQSVEYEFDEVYNNLVKMATFTDENGSYAIQLLTNECTIPYEILETEGIKEFGLFGYEIENEELVLRYSPTPVKKYVSKGSYKDEFDNYEEPTPSEVEEIKNNINKLNNDIIEVGEDVVSVEGDITTINQNIDDIENEIEGLKDRVSDVEYEIGEIGNALDTINGETIGGVE